MNELDTVKHRKPEEEPQRVTATRQELLAIAIMSLGIIMAIYVRPEVGVIMAIIGFALLVGASRYRFK